MHLTSALDGMTLAIPELGWRKTAKAPGKLEADIRLGTAASGHARLTLSGPGLTAQGQVLLKADGGLDVARFDKVTMGGWLDGAVAITGRGGKQPVGLAVTSGSIDLRKFPSNVSSGGGSTSASGSPLTIAVQSLRVTSGIRLTGFNGDFSMKGGFNGTFRRVDQWRGPGHRAPRRSDPLRYSGAAQIQRRKPGDERGWSCSPRRMAAKWIMMLTPRAADGEYDGTAIDRAHPRQEWYRSWPSCCQPSRSSGCCSN